MIELILGCFGIYMGIRVCFWLANFTLGTVEWIFSDPKEQLYYGSTFKRHESKQYQRSYKRRKINGEWVKFYD